MTSSDWLTEAEELRRLGSPFALATVVRCERPTSAKPGARALIRENGTLGGWIGGSCAEPLVVKEALDALQDGQPRLLVLVGQGATSLGSREGVREYAMTCHSGGTLEIYVEPVLPRPELVLVGRGPVVETLIRLAAAAGFATTLVERERLAEGHPRSEGGTETPGAGPPAADREVDDLTRITPTARTAIVVATHGRFDEEALERALAGEAGYVSLVASPKRARAVLETLRAQGVPEDRLRRLKAPAGLDLGAVTPEEIAVSILAEVVAWRRRSGPSRPPARRPSLPRAAEARDPVCGMTVAIATARHRSDTAAGPVYFCCAGCQRQFDLDPARYPVSSR